MLSLRIVYVDHYLSKPTLNLDPIKSALDDEPLNLVPVIRVFGTTSTGDKCCAHVHGFFPYLTVERDAFSEYSVDRLADELNKILNEVYPGKDGEAKKDTSKVYTIETIEAKNIYGYNECSQRFLRIYFLNPRSVQLAFKLIKQGKLFGCRCNVYEAHITYIMQFFVNFKLSGMNFMNLEHYRERTDRDRRQMSADNQHFIKQEKQSICKLEIDVVPQNIVVMRQENKFINPGLVLIWQEEKRRLIESNKDIKGVFKSNLKDCGGRLYTKKSLEQNYMQQLRDYLSYEENFARFHQRLNSSLSVQNRSFLQDSLFRNLNHSLSQAVIERIIQSEQELIGGEASRAVQQLRGQQIKLLSARDVRSQEFVHLIKNLKSFRSEHKNSSLAAILDGLSEEREDRESDDSCSGDELDPEKEARFTSLMLHAQDVISSECLNDSPNDFRSSCSPEKELFRSETSSSDGKTENPEEKSYPLSQLEQRSCNDARSSQDVPSSQGKRSSQSSADSSSMINPDNFNLNNESLIGTPGDCKEKAKSLDTIGSSELCGEQPAKSGCDLDDRLLTTGRLVSLSEDPLFSDEDDADTLQPSRSASRQSQFTILSQHSALPTSQLSDAKPTASQPQFDSQTDGRSIFSFYSFDSPSFLDQTTAVLSQPADHNELEENRAKNKRLADVEKASTSTPLHIADQSEDRPDKCRIRTSLGNKFLKLSDDLTKPQSPILTGAVPSIRIQSPDGHSNHSGANISKQLNRSNLSVDRSKCHESSFSMHEKIEHLSESSIDLASSPSRLSHEHQNVTLLTMELFAATEHEYKPNPLQDPIKLLFYMIYNDFSSEVLQQDRSKKRYIAGIIVQESEVYQDFDLSDLPATETSMGAFNRTTHRKRKPKAVNNLLYFQENKDIRVDYVDNELCLVEKFIELMIDHDPDIITGYEIETSSWGYLISRAEMLKINVSTAFSRLIIDYSSQQAKSGFQANNWDKPAGSKPADQCELPEEGFELSDQEDDLDGDLNPATNQATFDSKTMLNNNYLKRNQWETLERYKRNRPDFGTVKTRTEMRDKVKDNQELVKQFQTVFSLSYVSPCYMNLVGRIMLNLWRCIRKSELALNAYTYENVYYHLFKKRTPYYTCKQLTDWYRSDNNFLRQNVLNYYLIRVKGNLEMIDRLGIVNATSELARVFGIQFSDVISKGSQFRVESLLYRSTIEDSLQADATNRSEPNPEPKPQKAKFNRSIRDEMNLSRSLKKMKTTKAGQRSNEPQVRRQKFMLLSCNFDDRLMQSEPTIIPFIMEPKSNLYTNNVAVLDFQSLYPSIMIAHNYCYSTCLGRLDYLTNGLKDFPLGFASYTVPVDFVRENLENINISPNGVLFCNQAVRKGVLSSILEEILDTRLMVKKCLKMYQDEEEKNIARLLDARQLGLKLLSNVTYGYTAAGFSGRMPLIDLADAIISKGRETLINSINFINSSTEFGGEVIYGDTDSMFVEFKNTTREEAFRRAERLCELITLANPNPIKLKLEKVYSECVLLSKKHYAGNAYDTPDQKEPRFESKGIETIRRDTIGLVKRVMERSLKILFEKKSIDEIRPYLERVFYKVIHENGENLHQYIFAKQYRGVLGYRPRTYIPSMEIANQIAEKYGEHCRPFIKERVPYVIGTNQVDDRLVKMVYHPLDFLSNHNLRINSRYYIDRILIPPIQRVFGLLNLNIRQLYVDLPKKVFYLNTIEKQGLNVISSTNTNTLTNYFNFVKCWVCDRKIDQTSLNAKSICGDCLQNTQASVVSLFEDLRLSESRLVWATSECLDCTKMNCIQTQCKSIDCENLFRQNRLFKSHGLRRAAYETTLNELASQLRAKLSAT